MQFNFTKYSKFYYLFSILLIIGSIFSLLFFGLKFGIEFTGGSIMEVNFQTERPSSDKIEKGLAEFNLGEIIVQPVGDKGILLRLKGIDEETHQKILSKIKEVSPAEEIQFQSIGPTIGQELKQKTKLAIVLALVAITLYIAFAFRKVSRPVASWRYGITSLIALFHDVLIPLGVFSVLGKFYNVEITIPIIAALLTILGYSIHDTIVIFDRIRENLIKKQNLTFEEIINHSINETIAKVGENIKVSRFARFELGEQ